MKTAQIQFEDNQQPLEIIVTNEVYNLINPKWLNKESHYLTKYLGNKKLFDDLDKAWRKAVHDSITDEIKQTCNFCNGEKKADSKKACATFNTQALLSYKIAVSLFLDVMDNNSNVIKGAQLKRKLVFDFFRCFRFHNGLIYFDLKQMTASCLDANLVTIMNLFKEQNTLENLHYVNNALDELDTMETLAEVRRTGTPMFLEIQRKFYSGKMRKFKLDYEIQINTEQKSINNTLPSYAPKNNVDWATVFLFADRNKLLSGGNTTKDRMIKFITDNGFNCGYKVFSTSYNRAKTLMNDSTETNIKRLETLEPYLTKHYQQAVTSLIQEINYLKEQSSDY